MEDHSIEVYILDGQEKFNSFHTMFSSILTPFPHVFFNSFPTGLQVDGHVSSGARTLQRQSENTQRYVSEMISSLHHHKSLLFKCENPIILKSKQLLGNVIGIFFGDYFNPFWVL